MTVRVGGHVAAVLMHRDIQHQARIDFIFQTNYQGNAKPSFDDRARRFKMVSEPVAEVDSQVSRHDLAHDVLRRKLRKLEFARLTAGRR